MAEPCELQVFHGQPQEAEAVIQSAMAGRGQDRLVDVDAPTMKQSVAWELALRVIHIREVSLRVVCIPY